MNTQKIQEICKSIISKDRMFDVISLNMNEITGGLSIDIGEAEHTADIIANKLQAAACALCEEGNNEDKNQKIMDMVKCFSSLTENQKTITLTYVYYVSIFCGEISGPENKADCQYFKIAIGAIKRILNIYSER